MNDDPMALQVDLAAAAAAFLATPEGQEAVSGVPIGLAGGPHDLYW